MSGDETSGGGLTGSQRRSVLGVGLLAVALALTVPVYYAVAAVVPVAAVIPPVVPLTAMGVGLCVVFPATFGYAAWLRRQDDESDYAEDGREYGVDDRWERQNL